MATIEVTGSDMTIQEAINNLNELMKSSIISDDESELQADAIITSDGVKINICRVSSFASEEAAFGAMEYIKGVARKGLEK